LQLLGFEVDVVNSVQFSNHTGYPLIKGQKLDGPALSDLAEGLEANGILGDTYGRGEGGYTHLLTGYIGSPTFLRAVLELLDKMQRAAGPEKPVMYVCDPVMGDDGKLYVPEGLAEIYAKEVLPRAHMIVPNQFEAELLLGFRAGEIDSLGAAAAACEALHALGPKVVALTTVDACASDAEVAMLLSEKGRKPKWLLKLPRVAGGPFTGTGDLASAMFLARADLHPLELPLALEKVGALLQEVLRATVDPVVGHPRRLYEGRAVPPELQLVRSKRAIEDPTVRVRCKALWPQTAMTEAAAGADDGPATLHGAWTAQSPPIRGVVFDMDGTLTAPGQIDFERVRSLCKVPPGEDIVLYLQRKHAGDTAGLAAAMAVVEEEEKAAFIHPVLQPGLADMLGELQTRGVRIALLTRNSTACVELFLEALRGSSAVTKDFRFDPVLTRDSLEELGMPNKPDPSPVLHCCTHWGLTPEEVLVVGDGVDDVRGGAAAGCRTCAVLGDEALGSRAATLADCSVSHLEYLVPRLF